MRMGTHEERQILLLIQLVLTLKSGCIYIRWALRKKDPLPGLYTAENMRQCWQRHLRVRAVMLLCPPWEPKKIRTKVHKKGQCTILQECLDPSWDFGTILCLSSGTLSFCGTYPEVTVPFTT